MAKIVNVPVSHVCLSKMEDGDIAEIVKWGINHIQIGKIVQRYKNNLIVIGSHSGAGWSDIFKPGVCLDDCIVRILPPGTQIEL